MSDMVRIKKSTLDGIAHAIQEQEGSTAQIQAKEMENRIRTLTGGAVEHTTGTATFGLGYTAKTIPHGLSKPPKVFLLRWEEYDITPTVYLCGAFYTELAAATFYSAAASLSFSAYNVALRGVYVPGYGDISVDETNFYITENSRSWKGGNYTWEAYTW